jgi:hypothetical protein
MAQQRQEHNYPPRTFKPTTIHNTNAQRSANSMMLSREIDPTASASTTTDQYHHTETIWRIVIDAISLLICKMNFLF